MTTQDVATASTQDVLRLKFDQLVAEKEAIEKQAAPLRAKLDAAYREREALTLNKINPLKDQIKDIERPEGGRSIIEISEEISRLAMAMGGRRMGNPEVAPEEQQPAV